MNAAIDEIPEELLAPSELLPPDPGNHGVFYDRYSGSFWIPDGEGSWTKVNETGASRYLRIEHRIPRLRDEARISPLERTLLDIQRRFHVGYAGALAGYSAGLIKQNGENILVTAPPTFIEPIEGEFLVIEKFLDGLLGDQRIYFDCWLRIAVEALRKKEFRPGQALVLAGPKDCGKSVAQNQIITPSLGGRMAKPYLFMSGATSFNSNLFEAEHLMVEDDIASCDIRSRRSFGNYIKQFAANEQVQHHAKNKQAMTLKPFWRMSISCNEEPENLMILPPIDDSLADKMIILRAYRSPMPMPTETPEERNAFQARIRSELPAYLDYILKREIPQKLRAPRYGVVSFQNPEILRAMNDIAPEFQLLELIDELFKERKVPWEGKAVNLESDLESCAETATQARKLLYASNTCGIYLGRLADKRPDRVIARGASGSHSYTILFPPNAHLPPKEPMTYLRN
jgi:hypothetical protein